MIILDLEATCWEHDLLNHEQEIIEIAGLKLNNYGDEISRFHSMVKPQLHPYLSRYCTELTGIEQSELDHAPYFPEVWEQFITWAGDESNLTILAWGDGDLRLFENSWDIHNMDEAFIGRYIDFKSWYCESKQFGKKIGLLKALRKERIEFEGDHHRAMPDAENLLKLYRLYRM